METNQDKRIESDGWEYVYFRVVRNRPSEVELGERSEGSNCHE